MSDREDLLKAAKEEIENRRNCRNCGGYFQLKEFAGSMITKEGFAKSLGFCCVKCQHSYYEKYPPGFFERIGIFVRKCINFVFIIFIFGISLTVVIFLIVYLLTSLQK